MDTKPRFQSGPADFKGNTFGLAIETGMTNMDLNVGVIRDKQGIYSGLLQSQSTHRHLAICYSQDEKLIVKITAVKEIVNGKGGILVVVSSSDDPPEETTIPLDNIRSIYPISDFIH